MLSTAAPAVTGHDVLFRMPKQRARRIAALPARRAAAKLRE
jgi:hypothetical protein